MFIITWFKNLLNRNKMKAKFSAEERMNICDPDWRDDVARERSYAKIGLIILGGLVVIMLAGFALQGIDNQAAALHCTRFELIMRVYYHIFPHVPLPGKDLIK